jgi:hypothetical protein
MAMKKIVFIALIAVVVTAGSVLAQMGSGQHMMGTSRQPQAQTQSQQGAQPFYGMHPGMMGYGMYPGMMPGYGMNPGMMGGYGMQQPMMGYGMGYGMHPGMMGYGTAPCMSGYGMQQPMMGYGMGYGMHPGMMGYGMPHTYPQAGGNIEKQREFLKETSKLRKKLHDLMFDHMEAQWQADTKPEQLEKLGREIRGLQQELNEKSREALK